MIIKKYKTLKEIKDVYTYLYNTNPLSEEFQSFEYLSNRQEYMKFQHIVRRTKYAYYIVYDIIDGKETPILILPLQFFKQDVRAITTLDSLDIVYNIRYSTSELSEALSSVLQTINKPVLFENVTQFSKLYEILSIHPKCSIIEEKECGKILFGTNYDDYFSTISKSNRQNIRTAYNRLKSDDKNFELKMSFGKSDNKTHKKLKSLYANRYGEKNQSKSKLRKLFVHFYEPISKLCAKSSNGFNSILYIDNEIAAFMSGFQNKNTKSITIPRLVYNSKFSRYSPGILLINETIKQLILTPGFEILDLGLGNENYKYVMSATQYKAFCFVYNK